MKIDDPNGEVDSHATAEAGGSRRDLLKVAATLAGVVGIGVRMGADIALAGGGLSGPCGMRGKENDFHGKTKGRPSGPAKGKKTQPKPPQE